MLFLTIAVEKKLAAAYLRIFNREECSFQDQPIDRLLVMMV